MNVWTFGRCAPVLETNGFQPIPISRPHPSDPALGKKPPGTLAAWQCPMPVASRLPRYSGCGTGILTATTPAVDIDVRQAELADAIDRIVVEMAGDAPVRYGQAPKRLRVYRTAEPFTKLTTAGYRLPGEAPGDKAHKVEILADGQQFVAYGIHATTGMPYAWPEDDLLNLERGDLPELTPALAACIRDAAERVLAKAGTAVASRNGGARPVGQRQPGPAPRAVRDLAEARQVLDTLRSIDPGGLDYDTWVRTAYGVKAALGEHGHGAWVVWSARSAKDVPATTERTWASVKPERCGWRYLEHIHGAALAARIVRGGGGHG